MSQKIRYRLAHLPGGTVNTGVPEELLPGMELRSGCMEMWAEGRASGDHTIVVKLAERADRKEARGWFVEATNGVRYLIHDSSFEDGQVEVRWPGPA